MAIPAYLWLKDDGGALIKGSVDVKDREGSIEVNGFSHNLSLPTSEPVLLRAAGWAQSHSGNGREEDGNWSGLPPYGDDPKDQFWIKRGIDFAKRTGF